MRTTKKVISFVLAACMVCSASVITGFAATKDEASATSSDNILDSTYSKACEDIDKEYTYSKNDLGATYSKESTTFKVWSPKAVKVSVNLYTTGSDTENGARKLSSTALSKVNEDGKFTGVWAATIAGNLKNVYYTYSISTYNTTGSKLSAKETADVYSIATGINGNRSMVCDLDSTDPKGWDKDSHVLLDQSTDSSVWELHVKDFSYDKASGVSELNRGKYLAFTENGTTVNNEGNVSTCIDYLKELGITTVQLNPVYDFGSINEAGDDSQFNWGYDPQNYNVPEGSYSSNPYDGNVRINEFKQMVQALHNAGISVVMDVVYNHTFSTNSCFQATVPNYYYRMNADGTFSNGSGCGNECATERAMYRNYMIQSCLYWVNEYHIDGFRFDLMGIMDVETMNLVRAALDEVDPRITTWGEGWSGGASNRPSKTCTGETFYPTLQGNASLLSDRIAFFNDGIRDGIKGNSMGIGNQGFVQGSKISAKDIAYGIRANTVGTNKWKAQAPSQCVTYSNCHDNATLYDQLLGSTGLAPYGQRNATAVKMNKLGGAIIYSSQGITFSLAGEELCRSKGGDTNSYKSPADVNMIKWQNAIDYADVVSYYKGLTKIKSSFTPLTTMGNDYATAFKFNTGLSTPTNTFAFTVTNDQTDEWQKMAVIYNSAKTEQTVTLKDTSCQDWVILANDKASGLESLGEVTGSEFTLPAYSAIIAVDKASYDSLATPTNTGKVNVNYVYEKTGEKLDDTVVLQGTQGTGYQTTESAAVPNTYVVSKVTGNTTGKFSDTTQEVTYYYEDYIPQSLLDADLNGDEIVDINDATYLQKELAGKVKFTDAQKKLADVNYDSIVDVNDVTMMQKYLAGMSVSTGNIEVNYYYTDDQGNIKNLTTSKKISGRVGTDFKTDEFKIVGYKIDSSKYPQFSSGKIPYGPTLEVNYYYVPSSLDITLHVKHNGSQSWAPTLWIWGSNTQGNDTDNYTTSGTWPGDTLESADANGWFTTGFTYHGTGSYNIIVSDSGKYQTQDYKGFVDNDLWVVIDDSKLEGGSYLTFYTENPDTNPNAPIASQIG